MKELGMHISKMSRDWIPGAFAHALTAALEDLALNDIWTYNNIIDRCIEWVLEC